MSDHASDSKNAEALRGAPFAGNGGRPEGQEGMAYREEQGAAEPRKAVEGVPGRTEGMAYREEGLGGGQKLEAVEGKDEGEKNPPQKLAQFVGNMWGRYGSR